MTEKTHPWANFLDARYETILWMTKKGYDDHKIAESLSMDAYQVLSIKIAMATLERKLVSRKEAEEFFPK